jgi:hypothetical protein
MRPIISATVTPNPLESTQSPTRIGDDINLHNHAFINNTTIHHTTNNITNQIQSNTNYDNNTKINTEANDATNPLTTTAMPVHHNHNSPHQKRYLISQFFTTLSTTSSRRNRATNTIQHNENDNEIPQPKNTTISDKFIYHVTQQMKFIQRTTARLIM